MDLTTIHKRVASGGYSALVDVARDIKQIFTNCYLYNMDMSPVYVMAQRLEKFFEEEVLPSLVKLDENETDAASAPPDTPMQTSIQ